MVQEVLVVCAAVQLHRQGVLVMEASPCHIQAALAYGNALHLTALSCGLVQMLTFELH